MARAGFVVCSVGGRPLARPIVPDDVVAAARGELIVKGCCGQIPLALDEEHRRTLDRSIDAGWCATSLARSEDAPVRWAYWTYCVVARIPEVFACFDDAHGGATVGVSSFSASRSHFDVAWCARLASALERYPSRTLLCTRDGPTAYGVRPRDVEEVMLAILPIAQGFVVPAK